MDDQQIKVDLVRDGDNFGLITISDGGTSFARLKLSAVQLDDLILGLGKLRARLQPQVPSRVDRGIMIPAIRTPSWHAQWEPLTDELNLMFRHPGFGWLALVLPRQAVERIAFFLNRWPDPSKSVGAGKH